MVIHGMSLMAPKYWLVAITVASFALGTTVGPTLVTKTIQALKPDQGDQTIEKFSEMNEKINQKLEKLSNEINETRNSKPDDKIQGATEAISSLQKQVKILDAKITTLSNLPNDIDELKKEVKSLKETPVQPQTLLAVLDKSEYRAGDSLTVSGVGLPNTSVKISLLDSDKVAISEGSTTSDSTGKFNFAIQLSKSLVSGSYTVRVNQEGRIIENGFKIVSGTTAQQQTGSTTGLTISVDRSEYGIGDKVVINGKTNSSVWVDLDVFDANKVEVVRTSTKSDTNGNYRYEYTVPSNAALGSYEVKATIGNNQASAKFSVSSASSSSSPSSSSGSLTIVTDKSSYNRGELVRLSGIAPAGSAVTITVVPPFGDNMILTPTADTSGNYHTLMYIKSDAATGAWKLTAKQGTDTATITMQVI